MYYLKKAAYYAFTVLAFLAFLIVVPFILLIYHFFIDVFLGFHPSFGLMNMLIGFVFKTLSSLPLLYILTVKYRQLHRFIVRRRKAISKMDFIH